MSDTVTAHISVRAVIEGQVQGVWYRSWTQQQAGRLGLAGWVKNCADGSVEAVFSGPGADVDAMLAACLKGPPMASVKRISATETEAPIDAGFHTR